MSKRIQKQINKKKPFTKHPLKKPRTAQKERKYRKMTENVNHEIKKKKLNIENHHDLEVSPKKL